jgi:hypothetical protein
MDWDREYGLGDAAADPGSSFSSARCDSDKVRLLREFLPVQDEAVSVAIMPKLIKILTLNQPGKASKLNAFARHLKLIIAQIRD